MPKSQGFTGMWANAIIRYNDASDTNEELAHGVRQRRQA